MMNGNESTLTNEEMDARIKGPSMLAGSIVQQDKPATLIKERLFSRKYYEGKTLYQFCPFCVDRQMHGKPATEKDRDTLSAQLEPLEIHKFKCLYRYLSPEFQGFGIVLFEDRLFCSACRKYITDRDFENLYATGPVYQKYSKLIDLSDLNALNNF